MRSRRMSAHYPLDAPGAGETEDQHEDKGGDEGDAGGAALVAPDRGNRGKREEKGSEDDSPDQGGRSRTAGIYRVHTRTIGSNRLSLESAGPKQGVCGREAVPEPAAAQR
jgi:hypothetical protein